MIKPQHTFKNLLVVMTDRHIGNLLVSLYAIKSAHQQLSSGQTLCCVIDFHLMPLAEYLLPEIDFIPCTVRGKKPSPLKKITLLIKLLFKLKSRKIDTAVDLYGHGESFFIARHSGADYISAYYTRPNIKAKYHWCDESSDLNPCHQLDYYLYPFFPMLGEITAAKLSAPTIGPIIQKVEKKLTYLNIDRSKPLVVVHPGAGKDYKLWPIKHWQTLIKKLEAAGKQVLLIGAGSDKQQIDAILADKTIKAVESYQRFNLIETIHLGFIAQCLVGNDSGPTHLMATTPTTVFSLFGPTDDTLWAPLSPNSHIVKSTIPCLDSCAKGSCQREVSCLETISPEQVFEKINALPIQP